MRTAGDRIEVYANGTLVGGTTVDASGHYSVTTTTLNVGFNYITVKAIDPAGNQSPNSSGLAVTIDPTVPDIYTGTIAGSSDFKIYAVSLGVGERLTASITTPDGLNTYLRLFDASWNELVANDDTIDAVSGQTLTNSSLTYRSSQDGLFYVGVSSAANQQYSPTSSVTDVGSTTTENVGDYTLRLDHDPNDAPTFNNTSRVLTVPKGRTSTQPVVHSVTPGLLMTPVPSRERRTRSPWLQTPAPRSWAGTATQRTVIPYFGYGHRRRNDIRRR